MKNERTISRRQIFTYGCATLAGTLATSILGQGCAKTSFQSTSADTSTGGNTSTSSDGVTCSVIPTETNGPYPADNSDRAINALTLNGIVRSDITSSLATGSYSGTKSATGIPLRLSLNLVNVSSGCSALSGYAVYIWHCDVNGLYSMYSTGVSTDTFLRGVQETDSSGNVTFQTILPGCYDGRYPHIHFEIYPSLAKAVTVGNVAKISQLTFPIDLLKEAYNGHSDYSSSLSNFTKNGYSSNGYSKDNIFSDGATLQIASLVSGSYSTGYHCSMNVGIKA